MESEQREQWIKRLKSTLIGEAAQSQRMVRYDREQIEHILPHRHPFALLDRITEIDPDGCTLVAEADIDPDDPVFAGHFPDQPIYPGVLQIEMMGQAGLCLVYFLQNASTLVDRAHRPVKGLFTRVHNAGFIQAIYPGDTVTVRATVIEHDDFFGVMGVQLCKDGKICAHSILEAYLVD
jgi:3-hydroxymyristoyl/3-hydroxydecanoyl-(acyl carrier protein) dehydratase